MHVGGYDFFNYQLTYSGSIPQGLVVVLVSDGLRSDLHVAGVRLCDADEPGAALAERCRHVVRE